jgi:hypothetical protein
MFDRGLGGGRFPMKLKVELELTPEEAKKLYVNIPASTIPIMTELTTQLQKQWFEQMQIPLKMMGKQ